MKKVTEDILIAFALHEGLDVKKVRAIFQQQSHKDQRQQLLEMKQVIKRPLVKQIIPIEADKSVPEAKNDVTESPTTKGKDEQ